ncbi:hypothetical protein MFUM_230020 [Methylacidiphilum fumariolicum SolV]|uniref:Uncharacterized protein n=1 Tax=Methylacidiphilum fumariolicum (strain SolV) TaxID=1156937 RepID=I0JX72_METFB|nr:hypothetical protein MFUM_230020 [Methylacidiphilum fumariolicum SolV]
MGFVSSYKQFLFPILTILFLVLRTFIKNENSFFVKSFYIFSVIDPQTNATTLLL